MLRHRTDSFLIFLFLLLRACGNHFDGPAGEIHNDQMSDGSLIQRYMCVSIVRSNFLKKQKNCPFDGVFVHEAK